MFLQPNVLTSKVAHTPLSEGFPLDWGAAGRMGAEGQGRTLNPKQKKAGAFAPAKSLMRLSAGALRDSRCRKISRADRTTNTGGLVLTTRLRPKDTILFAAKLPSSILLWLIPDSGSEENHRRRSDCSARQNHEESLKSAPDQRRELEQRSRGTPVKRLLTMRLLPIMTQCWGRAGCEHLDT